MAGSNPFLEGLRVKLARMQAGQEPGGKFDTSIIQGMIKALEKAEADAAKQAAVAVPAVVAVDIEEEEEVEAVQSPIKLCLFDLDDTLLRTDDLDPFPGQANVGISSRPYTDNLLAAFGSRADRMLYTLQQLRELRLTYPDMKWGVFTRSPKHYATTLLTAAYPGLQWDAIVAYEDVRQTKPHPDGVWAAMSQCGVQYVDQVALVGDGKVDIQSAYNSGCWCILDQSGWTWPWQSAYYYAVERIPDAIITQASSLTRVLAHPKGYWPQMEYVLDDEAAMAGRTPRFDTINHFFPWPDNGRVPITMMGRLFGEYEALKHRRQWHPLTAQIHEHKNSAQFPGNWIQAIRSYLLYQITPISNDCVVTVIPFKPGRPQRLEALLGQLAKAEQAEAIHEGCNFQFAPAVMAFRAGAVSSHGQHLTREQRFSNVRDNLVVQQAETVRGQHVVVIDDVTTTGATLLWAHRYLMQAGARSVSCMSLTKAVGVG